MSKVVISDKIKAIYAHYAWGVNFNDPPVNSYSRALAVGIARYTLKDADFGKDAVESALDMIIKYQPSDLGNKR